MNATSPNQHFNRGVRAAIAWLHRRADKMNDPHATRVLNSAAFSLGVHKPNYSDVKLDPPAWQVALKSLKAAEQFIVNGVELGFIHMPEHADDPAHGTLPVIRDAIEIVAMHAGGVMAPETVGPDPADSQSTAVPIQRSEPSPPPTHPLDGGGL